MNVVDFPVFEKINGEIPFKSGNTLIPLKIKIVFPLISPNSLDFALFSEVNRNFSVYIASLASPIRNSRKFSAYEFSIPLPAFLLMKSIHALGVCSKSFRFHHHSIILNPRNLQTEKKSEIPPKALHK